MVHVALSIAGSDPSGGAGLQADLKTFAAHQVFGQAVVSLLTVQNTLGVQRVQEVQAGLVAEQLQAVLEDQPPGVVKTGALGGPATVEAVAGVLAPHDLPLVVDPVLLSSSGEALASEGALESYRKFLLPIALLVTPNRDELSLLSGHAVSDAASAERAARSLATRCGVAVLAKGGHLQGDPVDVLVQADRAQRWRRPRVESRHTHGTGCAYSAAIAARLCRGVELPEAIGGARDWLQRALRSAPGLGRGHGPLDLLQPADVAGVGPGLEL